MAGPGSSALASFTNSSPSSAPKPTSSERSSCATPAKGLATIAQAATRVTGFSAGRPPSENTTSLQVQTRLTSMSPSEQPRKISFEHKLCLRRRQRILHKLHRMRLAERKRRVAAKHDLLDRYYLGDIPQHRGLETDGIDIELAQIVADWFGQYALELRVGVDLTLHAGAQRRAERTTMRTNQLKRGPTVEKARTDHLQNVDGRIEEITRNDREFVVAGAVLPERVGWVHEQGNIEIDGGLYNGLETGVVQIKTTDIGGDMAADKAVIADTAAQFLGGGFRVLHRQQGPAAKSLPVRRDRRRQAVVED